MLSAQKRTYKTVSISVAQNLKMLSIILMNIASLTTHWGKPMVEVKKKKEEFNSEFNVKSPIRNVLVSTVIVIDLMFTGICRHSCVIVSLCGNRVYKLINQTFNLKKKQIDR